MKRMYVALLAVLVLLGIQSAQAHGLYWKKMDTIISDAHAELCDHDFSRARASTLVWERRDGTSLVVIRVRGAVPNSLYTVWLKLAGASPITGAGATPLAASGDIQEIMEGAGTDSAAGANAFYTNARGNGTLVLRLDYHLTDGVYPFSAFDADLSDVAVGDTPFTLRVISHCTDGLQHGMVPGPHEPTFQISL